MRIKWQLLSVMLLVLCGCATTQQAMHKDNVGFQEKLKFFEQAKGLTKEDVPEQYNCSRLKEGSHVKIKYMLSYSNAPNFMTRILRQVKSTDNGKVYLVDYISGNTNFPYEVDSVSLAKIILPYEATKLPASITDYKSQRTNLPTAIITGILTGGPIGVALNVADYHNMKEIDESIAQGLKSRRIESKLIDFRFISEEEILIAHQRVACKVYEVHTMTRHTQPLTPRLPGICSIIDENKKIWISDDVPFGFVKSQGTQKLYIDVISNKRFPARIASGPPQEEFSEVVEFSY